MAVHHFEPTRYYSTLGPHEPVLHIAPGDTVITTTIDAGGRDRAGRQVAEGANPLTGPFYVEGARRGDTLVLVLEHLAPNREHGYSSTAIAPNVVDPGAVPALPERTRAAWHVDRELGLATLVSPATRLRSLSVPLAPMLGCFGVAADGGQAIGSDTSGTHGGNMDYRGFVAGVTVYLPVFEPGALLFLGDGHAVQGDGEIAGTGVEVSFDVRFSVHTLQGEPIGWPRGESADYIFTVGNARPLDQALQHATTEMIAWLQAAYDLDPVGISLLLGQCVRYDVGNVFDPAYTVVCKLHKKWLAGRGPA